MKTKKTTNTFKRPFDLLVMRLKQMNPWLTVKWIYTESDDKGLRLLKSEGTTYLWRALVIAGFLLAANFLIALTGVQNVKSDLFIVDA
jgi:hypothetical protein